MQPPFTQNEAHPNDLKSAALRFLRERCEQLRFDPVRTRAELEDHICLGTSLSARQIPYNMERDLDRVCLEKSLEAFIDSGTAEDAYNVYYCYIEIFLSNYGAAKQMVELLSEFEQNGSSVLMKHRDHYSHSVYVFALGLAIYETNEAFRRSFRRFYALEERRDNEVANLFLRFWGLTALFHDIGYPFELPFEQVLSYFEVEDRERGKGSLFLAYRGLRWPALIVFIIASLSDLLDGYIARHYHQVTNFGKFMDPLADKMLVLAAMCFFVEKGQMPGWVMALVLFREFAVSGLRLVAAEQNRVIAAAWSGKVKTTCTMVGLCFMMVFGKYEAMNIFVSIVILATTVYSGIEYFYKNRDVFRDAD